MKSRSFGVCQNRRATEGRQAGKGADVAGRMGLPCGIFNKDLGKQTGTVG
jgi:hypothetical protein